MRKNDKKIFLNKRILVEMLEKRASGWSISALSMHYHCDKSSIRYQIHKYSVNPLDKEIYAIDRIIMQTFPKIVGNWKEVNGERINLGKSYKEYLAESKYPPKAWV